MTIITGLLGKLLASKLGLAGAAALGGALLTKLAPLARPLLGRLIKAQLDKALAPNLADPVEKEKLNALIVAAISYAEYKIPDRGQGQAKKQLVVSTLSKVLPSVAAEVIGTLVQEAFDSLDDDLKNRVKG